MLLTRSIQTPPLYLHTHRTANNIIFILLPLQHPHSTVYVSLTQSTKTHLTVYITQLFPSKWFCHNVSKIFLPSTIFQVNDTAIKQITKMMMPNINMLCLHTNFLIAGKFNTPLVVFIPNRWSMSWYVEIRQQLP